MAGDGTPSGTGSRFGDAVVIVAGVSALSATLLTCVSIWLQSYVWRQARYLQFTTNRTTARTIANLFCSAMWSGYFSCEQRNEEEKERELIDNRVPIYSAASWVSLISIKAAFWVDPFRDVYEAFTIYTFFQLLINFIGGERSLIIMMYGRKPVSHLWPMNHCLPKVDISDPHTFLAIKRGILQYAWMKPVLAIATIIMKATDTYKEGYIGLTSGYLWSGLIYNLSITISLYALAMFWVCMSADLKPFRPMPKFLCVKGIIFASYWQGFFLSILVWLGAIPDSVPGYSADNLAAAIQDALICFEMPLFAIAHWYAFSWHDYADVTISSARMPVKYALRDAFGPVDLIQDTKQTFSGKKYGYRAFDAHDNVLAHEDSSSRTARMMAGMRYERGGKGKYWIPEPEHSSKTPLLGSSRARTMSPSKGYKTPSQKNTPEYGATEDGEEVFLEPVDERLYDNARALEFGDWNYPVITAHTADREAVLHRDPSMITASTNRHVLQPTRANKQRRKSRIQDIQDHANKGKHRTSSSGGEASKSKAKSKTDHRPLLSKITSQASSSSSGAKSDRSQLVDLVIEDHEAEEIERVRARKEGGSEWNEAEPKHFVRADDGKDEVVREGYEPGRSQPRQPHGDEENHNLNQPFAGDSSSARGGEDFSGTQGGSSSEWEDRNYDEENEHAEYGSKYGSFREERNVWGSRDD